MANKRDLVRKIGIFYILCLACLAWGFAIGAYHVFPWKQINGAIEEITAFIAGDDFEKTTLREKIQSDFTDIPKRFLYPKIDNDLQLATTEVSGDMFAESRLRPTYYSSSLDGHYLIYGIMEFTNNRYGAAIVSSRGEVKNTWHFETPQNGILNPVKGGFDPVTGTVFSNVGKALIAFDFCANELYRLDGIVSHHSITSLGDETVWLFDNLNFERRESRTGKLLERFSILEIMTANPELSIFEPRLAQKDWYYKDLPEAKLKPFQEVPSLTLDETEDPFHFNDITPLTKELAPLFPTLAEGDLLISSRALNLVFVVDPKTYKVKKYLYGRTSRQHDPDFSLLGKVTIFDNQNHRPSTRIVTWDVASNEVEILFDGASINFSNEAHGNHTVLDDKSFVFVDHQGRIYHFDELNKVRFYFENQFDSETNLELRNVWYISDEKYERLNQMCRTN